MRRRVVSSVLKAFSSTLCLPIGGALAEEERRGHQREGLGGIQGLEGSEMVWMTHPDLSSRTANCHAYGCLFFHDWAG